MSKTNFNKNPFVETPYDSKLILGWNQIVNHIKNCISEIPKPKKIVALELYQGVLEENIIENLSKYFHFDKLIVTSDLMYSESYISEIVYPFVTDDRIFGYWTSLTIEDYFDAEKIKTYRSDIKNNNEEVIVIIGPGASYVYPNPDLLIYADMARWEIQLRMRQHEVNNLGLYNRNTEDWMLLYKQGYFVDWRVLDQWKKKIWHNIDYFLDTNDRTNPKLAIGNTIFDTLDKIVHRPFSVVPFFDPGPWGGQWMKNHCNLDPETSNYAWCFNCVPEENSLLIKFSNGFFEIPSINLVFTHPKPLLGKKVFERFGAEFPIRFDFLDTVEGGNLSLQVHPLTSYIKDQFGMSYTQDESYYILHANEDAHVFLGLKEDINPAQMIFDLKEAQKGEIAFETEKHVKAWPVQTHDHLLIPAGTVHCSGKGCLVLEISSTPYIFTFKMWDWGRLGLDGKPRPINIDHAQQVIQWDRVESWTKKNLVNRIEPITSGEGWKEEKTGLHELEFIETRRFWFTNPVTIEMTDSVYVGCVIKGEELSIESPSQDFEPFIVHYAETFIVPASVKQFIMKPLSKIQSDESGVILAFVR